MLLTILKCIKKRRLLKKYKRTTERTQNDMRLHQLMRDDLEFREWHLHMCLCEVRCYKRLKKL